jgi:hypothetical protein
MPQAWRAAQVHDRAAARACRAGADTIYSVVETAGHEHTYVTATLALRDRSIRVSRTPAAAVTAPEPPAAVAPPERDCDPICSPGFACVAVAVCSPVQSAL